MEVRNIDIAEIHQLSSRDRDYYLQSEKFGDFLVYDFKYDEFKKVIAQRTKFPVNRDVLYKVASEQYTGKTISTKTKAHLEALKSDNTFTVTTAHQPSLLSGPLYYVFKILSAINLSEKLKKEFPANNFVPVFVIGGEDHDFDEINHLHLYGKKISWEMDASGSVGKLPNAGIKEVIEKVENILGEKSQIKEFLNDIKVSVDTSKEYGEFSFNFTHDLFDRLGLVILRMDRKAFKQLFIPSIKREILESPSKGLIEAEQEKLVGLGYKAQTHIRDINFFYRGNGFRNRIEKEGSEFKVVDTELSFSEEEMIKEIENSPEKFSPNVNIRPLFQSQILPDLAYIGGGGELAYWMERKEQFKLFEMHFPMLIRRRSAMIVNNAVLDQSQKLGLSLGDLFQQEDNLVKLFLSKSDNVDYKLDNFKEKITTIFKELESYVAQVDGSLSKTTLAEGAKTSKSIDYLESKLKKSIKQKEEINLKRINKLKAKLFPSGLQERHDNILEYLSTYGMSLLDKILPHCDPFDKTFKVFVMQPEDR